MLQLNPTSESLPKRSELPDIPGAPKGAAWFWGKDDELGRLNMLTSERTAAAAKLIVTGEVVNLNLRADLPNPPVFGREPFKHTIKNLGPAGNDDLYDMNTQSGSQWDGYRHVSAQHDGQWIFFNNTTQKEIETTTKIGTHAWADHGIVGRGVLIDYWTYAKKSYDPFTHHPISLDELLACAKAQGLEFQYGDILIIRSGWVDAYNNMNQDERDKLGEVKNYAHYFVGVEQSSQMLDFLHDNYFSAVAGDMPGFEAWPQPKEWNLHQILLPLWGLPIGEMWDLEKLADVCHKHKKFSFFFSSIPTNVKGGVGSYSNALAVF